MSLKRLGDKALAMLRGIAPLVASAVGGPYAGAASAIISQALGLENEDKIESFILTASPEDLLKLKLAELELRRWMREADLKEEDLIVKDRGDARNLAKDKGVVIQASLSGLFILGYFILLWLFFSNGALSHLSDFAKGQLGILIGVVTSAVPQILAFWFGSARGSKEKDTALAQAIQNANR